MEVHATPELPGPKDAWLMVEATSQKPTSGVRPVARLVVREGAANVPEIRLDKARTNIGRVVDVYRSQGIYRRNDLVFAEDTEINRSVSREHAHIHLRCGQRRIPPLQRPLVPARRTAPGRARGLCATA